MLQASGNRSMARFFCVSPTRLLKILALSSGSNLRTRRRPACLCLCLCKPYRPGGPPANKGPSAPARALLPQAVAQPRHKGRLLQAPEPCAGACSADYGLNPVRGVEYPDVSPIIDYHVASVAALRVVVYQRALLGAAHHVAC